MGDLLSKVGFISLGCPKNRVDSEVMLGLLKQQGHTVTPRPEDAEIVVVNTCSFIEDSKQESIDAILEAAELKKSGRCKKLVVTGCLAERYPRDIQENLVEVDGILGTNQLEHITSVVDGRSIPPPVSFGRSDADLYLYDHDTPRLLSTPSYSAYLKISEGCNHTCAFCIIPKIRGPFRSRTIHSIVEEARALGSRGVGEITLVSQDTTNYGTDLGAKDGLARLLEELACLDSIHWVRFLYLYPNGVHDRLLDVVASHEKICSYVDMPLQHSSTSVLKAMQRGGNRKSLSRLVARIRRRIPGVTVRTTMIVGFPGETEEDFLDLQDFCEEMEFDRLGVFTYSDEEDTAAYGNAAKVPRSVADERKAELMAQQAQIAARKNAQLINKKLPVLIEGVSAESEYLLAGRLESQAPEIDGVCLINDSKIPNIQAGEFRIFCVTDALGHDLLGSIVA